MFQNTVTKCAEFQPTHSYRKISVLCLLILTNFLVYQNYEYISKCSWKTDANRLELCPIRPPNTPVDEFTADISQESVEAVQTRFEGVLESDGSYKPKECRARDRVAVLVTYRGREEQIPVFLKNPHPILMRQQLEYQVFIIIQTDGYWFNKGALYNSGFLEAMKKKEWDCSVFHDIDMVPMDDRNIYDCPRVNPRHMAIDVDKFKFK